MVGCPTMTSGQRIVAFVVGDAEPDALIDHVAQQLSVHKRPREVRLVEAAAAQRDGQGDEEGVMR